MDGPSIFPLLVFTFFLHQSPASASIFEQAHQSRCEPIQIPLCKGGNYDLTFFPNPIVQADLQSLQTQADHFKPLLKMACHPHLKFFVCSVFAPMCPESFPQAVTSCRSLCEEVKRDCTKILKDYSVEWPESLNCSKFPHPPELCMSPDMEREPRARQNNVGNKKAPLCPSQMVNMDSEDHHGLCAFKCSHGDDSDRETFMFTNSAKESAQFLMILGGCITFVVTAFTVLTFLIDRQRFLFPERSIFYISACYMLFSLPFICRLFFSYEKMACHQTRLNESFLVVGTLDNSACVLSVIFTYYFAIAGSIWWLMLTFTWYLSAARKWVQEGIDACSSYLHLIAWALPALLTIAVFVTHKVDASEFTGVCSVGNANPWALLGFVIIPKLIFVLLGSCFIVAGFSSMCRERDSFRRRGTDTSKLEKLMIKMGIFSAFYIIPAITMVICDANHLSELLKWHPATTACKQFGGGCVKPDKLPQTELYKINVIMSMLVGISTGMWTVSSKTFHSWQRVICCGLCSSAPAKAPMSVGQTSALNRPLIPTVHPPPPPHHYLPMTASSAPSSHMAVAQPVWKQSKIV